MSEKNPLVKNVLFVAGISALVGGSTPVVAKLALAGFEPFTLTLLRFIGGALVLLPFVVRSNDFNLQSFKHFALAALLGAVNPILFFLALPHAQAALAPLMYATVPALTAFYFSLRGGMKLATRQIIGILLGFVGVSILIALPLFTHTVASSDLFGNVLLFAAAVIFAAYGVMSSRQQKISKASPLLIIFIMCVTGTLISIPLAAAEVIRGGLPTPDTNEIAAAIFIAIASTGIFYVLYQYALTIGSEMSAALFTYLQPIVTITLAYFFLSEPITLPFFIGGALAILGAQLASKETK